MRRLRLLVRQDAELSTTDPAAAVDVGSRLAGLIGAIDGPADPADLAERHDGHLRDRFSDPA